MAADYLRELVCRHKLGTSLLDPVRIGWMLEAQCSQSMLSVINAVAVEVHHMVGLAFFYPVVKLSLQCCERRRHQHRKFG